MQPRIIFNTHYQVDEPAYMTFLVKLCTSPVQSNYREVIAEKVAREITSRVKKLNVAAGGYAVDLAQDLELTTANNTWSEKGHLLNLIAEVKGEELEDQLKLNLPEKLLYFRIFLEADGAAFLFMARRLKQYGSAANSDATWNSWATELFVEVYSGYLTLTANTSDRVGIRQLIDRISSHGYEGKSGSHKIFLHLQTLYRLGLVERPNSAGSRAYYLSDQFLDAERGLDTLLREIPDILSLEKVIKTKKWINVAAKVFQIACVPYSDVAMQNDIDRVFSLTASYYRRIMSTGVPLCSLSTLIEAIQIELLTGQSRLLTYEDAMNSIVTAQKERPKDIRFHVDRRGQPAFIKLSDDIVRLYSA